ncbi:hypothetical protein [Spiroplasma sp. BIUS-1]|uniref:hypothetical protein n=1 Tax=Spiroplasma sp. BIUS-1 TaxID=216964 RepID=UPI00139962FB|nr:hypothetical protein [Spiroplasma sp. BIUS-1]QHX36468.1 hypothetical protein SBIUS_v1c02150 [Spiroplasma sp. BIUS-1]
MFNLLSTIEDGNNLLIISIVLLLVTPLSSISSWFITMKFKKTKSEIKFSSNPLLSTLITIQLLSIASSLLSLFSYFGLLAKEEDTARILLIVFVVFAAVLSAIWFSMVIFFSNQIWFYIEKEEDKLVTLGETIKLSKIVKIIEDDEKSAVYVNYLEGKRTLKKIKFSKKTTIGMYFLEIAEKTGVKPEKGNESDYFKEEVAKIRQAALQTSKPEVKKQDVKKEESKKEEK